MDIFLVPAAACSHHSAGYLCTFSSNCLHQSSGFSPELCNQFLARRHTWTWQVSAAAPPISQHADRLSLLPTAVTPGRSLQLHLWTFPTQTRVAGRRWCHWMSFAQKTFFLEVCLWQPKKHSMIVKLMKGQAVLHNFIIAVDQTSLP